MSRNGKYNRTIKSDQSNVLSQTRKLNDECNKSNKLCYIISSYFYGITTIMNKHLKKHRTCARKTINNMKK